jgi:hypothetical protein
MKKTLTSLTVALLALFGAQAAMAQAAAPARAEVKKEAADANKAGTTAKGEAGAKEAPAAKSDKPRAEVKKEAAAANKAGATSKGEAEAPKK